MTESLENKQTATSNCGLTTLTPLKALDESPSGASHQAIGETVSKLPPKHTLTSAPPVSLSLTKNYLPHLTVGLIGVIILSLLTGAYDILNQTDGWHMFWITRVPRTLSLLLSGAALAMCGLLMQLLTQNPFAEPTTTGTTEWAGLGLTLVYAWLPAPTLFQRMSGAVVFAFIGTVIFFLIIQRLHLQSSLVLPIVGMMLGAVVSAVSSFLSLIFSLSQSLDIWFTGSFTQVQQGRYEYLWLIAVITLLVFLAAERLMIAGLGKNTATSLGLNYQRMLLLGVALVALAVGIVTAVIGQLPFLGLIVPNLVSKWRGDDLRSNLPYVCLLGMMLMTTCDLVSRTLVAPLEMPVSLILGTLGGAIFLLLLWQQAKGGYHDG